jgi:Bacterial SH3 domain
MMKTIWTILGTMVAASLLAQNNTNTLPPIPPPVSSPAAETAPATPPAATTTTAPTPPKHKKPHKPVAKKKPAAPESSVTLAPGPAEVNASELVVRGQAGLKGELVTHLHKGDTVIVLEQINLSKHEAGEPDQWAKISFPTNAHLWVDSKFVDASGTVSSKKLNMRAGPGENYSVAGVLEKGTQVTKIETKGTWIKIEPPANAYAFVAAKFLTQEPAPVAVASNPPEAPEAPPTQMQVPEQPQIVTAPPPQQQPLIPPVRIVSHEGVVGTVGSPTAPTTYKIYDPDTKEDIDFLYPISANIDLGKLVDSRVIVTGEEGIDKRWPNTPIIAVQSIEVLQQDAVKRFSKQDLTPPRQRH